MPETRIPSGEDFRPAVKPGNTVLLERGGRYTLGSAIPAVSDMTLGSYGDTTKPKPVVICSAGVLSADSDKRIRVSGITFDGRNSKTSGVGLLNNCEAVVFEDVDLIGFGGTAFKSEGYKGRVKYVTLRGCLIDGAWSSTGGHVSGFFADKTDGLVLTGNVFTTNGWKPGTQKATVYNHNAYIQSYCGPAQVFGNVFHNASSHGLQCRSGGDVVGNIFIDNPVHLTHGYVEGGPAFKGGVEGLISGNVFIGGRDINGSKRGWCIDIANARNTILDHNLIAHDAQGTDNPVVQVHSGKNFADGTAELPRNQWKVRISDLWWWDWGSAPVLRVGSGITVDQSRVGIRPPVPADLRVAIGADFMSRARANPATAARDAVEACFVACGLAEAPVKTITLALPAKQPDGRLKWVWSPAVGPYTLFGPGSPVPSTNEDAYTPDAPGSYYVTSAGGVRSNVMQWGADPKDALRKELAALNESLATMHANLAAMQTSIAAGEKRAAELREQLGE